MNSPEQVRKGEKDRERRREGGRENFCSFSDHHPFVIFFFSSCTSLLCVSLCLSLPVCYLPPFSKTLNKTQSKASPFPIREQRKKQSHVRGTFLGFIFTRDFSPHNCYRNTKSPFILLCLWTDFTFTSPRMSRIQVRCRYSMCQCLGMYS